MDWSSIARMEGREGIGAMVALLAWCGFGKGFVEKIQ
jgi:hypothetical protein